MMLILLVAFAILSLIVAAYLILAVLRSTLFPSPPTLPWDALYKILEITARGPIDSTALRHELIKEGYIPKDSIPWGVAFYTAMATLVDKELVRTMTSTSFPIANQELRTLKTIYVRDARTIEEADILKLTRICLA
jgi:hypothetical protein